MATLATLLTLTAPITIYGALLGLRTHLRQRRARADAPSMRTLADITAQAIEDLQPGTMVALNSLPAGARLVDVVDFDPHRGLHALHCLDVHHDDMEIVVSLGQVARGWSVVQRPPVVPNVLSDADVELLRTRVDQRGT